MPNRLHRSYGAGYAHFFTTSCYRRLPLLGTASLRDLFLYVLEQVRRRYRFLVLGYVIMPEHVHLLIGGWPTQARRVAHSSQAGGPFKPDFGLSGDSRKRRRL